MSLLIGVSKTHTNVSKRRNPNSRSKIVYMAFYVPEGRAITSKRISKAKYYWLKIFGKKYKRQVRICTECSYKFQAIVENVNQEVECPNCL